MVAELEGVAETLGGLGGESDWEAAVGEAAAAREDAEGLAALPEADVRRLLASPRRLLSLGERLPARGGPHWDAAVARGPLDGPKPVERPPSDDGPPAEVPRPAAAGWPKAAAGFAAGALVATLALMAGSPGPGPGPGPNVVRAVAIHGWAAEGGLPPAGLSKDDYLGRPAKTAEQWGDATPRDRASLAALVPQFRAGCTRLIVADDRPLSPAEATWLRDRCRVRADKLDRQLDAFESEAPLTSAELAGVRGNVDAVVVKLAAALRAGPPAA